MSLLDIINVFFIAESSAVIGLLYILCLDKGMIFEYFGNIILKEVNEEKEIPKWKKPFGACQTCTLVWVGVIVTILFYYANPFFILLSIVSNALLIFRKIA